MANYGDSSNVTHTPSGHAGHPKYTKVWKIGEKPTYPGIYKCQKCGYEDVINRECTKLPPCSVCKDSNTWKLLVRAMDN